MKAAGKLALSSARTRGLLPPAQSCWQGSLGGRGRVDVCMFGSKNHSRSPCAVDPAAREQRSSHPAVSSHAAGGTVAAGGVTGALIGAEVAGEAMAATLGEWSRGPATSIGRAMGGYGGATLTNSAMHLATSCRRRASPREERGDQQQLQQPHLEETNVSFMKYFINILKK